MQSELARRLDAAMRAKRHSQMQASTMLGVSQSLLSKIKLDETRLVEDRWPAFAAYLKVDEDEIRRLAEDADAVRLARIESIPDLEARVARLEASVAQDATDRRLTAADVALLRAEMAKQSGMIEAALRILGGDPKTNPGPPRRPTSRRAK